MRKNIIFLVVVFLGFFIQEGNARLGFANGLSYSSSWEQPPYVSAKIQWINERLSDDWDKYVPVAWGSGVYQNKAF